VSGITGAPGQGEFYLTRYPTQGGNFETIVLAPNSAQECMAMTVEAFYLAERFRMPVTVLADQLITDASRISRFLKRCGDEGDGVPRVARKNSSRS